MLALVHNHDSERTPKIRASLSELSRYLKDVAEVVSVEVAFQAPIESYSAWSGLRKKITYEVLGSEWREYREQGRAGLYGRFRSLWALIRPFLKKKNRPYFEDEGRRAAIEAAVTDKHIRAWDFFLESDSEYLMFFEDDAVFSGDSCAQVGLGLGKVESQKKGRGLYVDLAGGSSLEELGIAALEEKRSESFITYRKPVTNTACAYLLNRKLAQNFRQVLLKCPWYRLIGIDWMMNKLFIELEKKQETLDCFHAFPSIFQHGSVADHFRAWRR